MGGFGLTSLSDLSQSSLTAMGETAGQQPLRGVDTLGRVQNIVTKPKTQYYSIQPPTEWLNGLNGAGVADRLPLTPLFNYIMSCFAMKL